MGGNNDDFEIGDVENFGGVKDKEFSHSLLVMSAMRKCLDAGSKEMMEGWFNERRDIKGNLIRTYVEDTRKAFIESVRTLKMIMACDIDKKASLKIKKCFMNMKEKEQIFIEQENEGWQRLSSFEKSQYLKSGAKHFDKVLSHPVLLKHFIEYELIQWRNIFAELSRLTKRLDFFKSEMFEA